MTRVAVLFALAGLAVACGGNGSGDDERVGALTDTATTSASAARAVSVAEARRRSPAGPVLVRGYVVSRRDTPIRLCTRLVGPPPPRCGSPWLNVTEELELDELPTIARSDDGAFAWTAQPVELIGLVRGGAFVIEEPHQ